MAAAGGRASPVPLTSRCAPLRRAAGAARPAVRATARRPAGLARLLVGAASVSLLPLLRWGGCGFVGGRAGAAARAPAARRRVALAAGPPEAIASGGAVAEGAAAAAKGSQNGDLFVALFRPLLDGIKGSANFLVLDNLVFGFAVVLTLSFLISTVPVAFQGFQKLEKQSKAGKKETRKPAETPDEELKFAMQDDDTEIRRLKKRGALDDGEDDFLPRGRGRRKKSPGKSSRSFSMAQDLGSDN